MKTKSRLFLILPFSLATAVSAQAGTQAWFSSDGSSAGVNVYDYYDSGSDHDATRLFETMQTPGELSNGDVIKSYSALDSSFSLDCAMTLAQNQTQCAIQLSAGNNTEIDSVNQFMAYQITGLNAENWLEEFAATGTSAFSYTSAGGALVINASSQNFYLQWSQR